MNSLNVVYLESSSDDELVAELSKRKFFRFMRLFVLKCFVDLNVCKTPWDNKFE